MAFGNDSPDAATDPGSRPGSRFKDRADREVSESQVRKVEGRLQRVHFNRVFEPHHDSNDVYDTVCPDTAKRVAEGYNETVLVYGQTGAGKTYTCFGSSNGLEEGIVPPLLRTVCKQVQKMTRCAPFLTVCGEFPTIAL